MNENAKNRSLTDLPESAGTIKESFLDGGIRPLFMWAGGKRRLLGRYAQVAPQGRFRAYVEPFFGAGAMFGAAFAGTRAVINDRNEELMSLFRWVRDDPWGVLATAEGLQGEWLSLTRGDEDWVTMKSVRKPFYMKVRERYWDMAEGTPESAGTLLFLLKTCFNGIWQPMKASGGKFGTPCGLARQTRPFISRESVFEWHAALSHADIRHDDFGDIPVPEGSFVFCDPPYRGSHTTYGKEFDDDDQGRVIDWCQRLRDEKGCVVWLANRLVPGDPFFRERKGDARVETFEVTYTAGRRKKTVSKSGVESFSAKSATEILLIWD